MGIRSERGLLRYGGKDAVTEESECDVPSDSQRMMEMMTSSGSQELYAKMTFYFLEVPFLPPCTRDGRREGGGWVRWCECW